MNYSPEIIGNKIKEQRSKKKWSQDTLGKKLNMSGKQISNYEKAILTPVPTATAIKSICNG